MLLVSDGVDAELTEVVLTPARQRAIGLERTGVEVARRDRDPVGVRGDRRFVATGGLG
jgi:hypothetical protein